MNYFENVSTVQELKAKYHQLCFKHHPDVTQEDTNWIMQEINNQYKKLFVKLSRSENGEPTTKDFEMEKVFMERIQSLIHFTGLQVELIGNWIWISGNTYPCRVELKEQGFFFAPKKKVWYWRPDEHKYYKRNPENPSLDEIKKKFGSVDLTNKIKNNPFYERALA